MKKKLSIILFVLMTFSTQLYAYDWIKYDSDGSYHGMCNNIGGMFSGGRTYDGYHQVTGPNGSFIKPSQSVAIRMACGE